DRCPGVEAVAVCLLWGFRHRDHERAAAELLAAELPDVHVSTSHETAGVFREYERCATTIVDAALSPLLRRYLERLAERAREAGLPEPEVMLSGGGVASSATAARHGSWTVLSGPAGGAVGAARSAERAGVPDVVCLDMGGTSCDVSVAFGGRAGETGGREVGGRALALPMVDVHTIGAGGGSIAWRDAGGALRVGPRSAGAEPGPACYGRGGEEPTVTDANLLLGYLDSDSPLAGGVELDQDAAQRAVGGLAASLGLSPQDAAAGIVRVASAEMARAVRVMTVERGIDPRDLALLAFGGAGEVRAGYDLRYAGQAFELTVPGDASPDPDALRRAFDAAHERRYGYSDPDAVLELVTIRVSVALPGGQLAAPAAAAVAEPRKRLAIFAGEPMDTTVLRGGCENVRGPAVCELREATLVVPPGWSGAADEDGTIVLERS